MKNKILNVEITSEEQRNELVKTFQESIKQLQEMKFEKPLPSSWEEYLNNLRLSEADNEESITSYLSDCVSEKYSAMYKLEKLMHVYNDGWKPDWSQGTEKHIIACSENDLYKSWYSFKKHFLTFKTKETRDLFLKNFEPLIKQYFEID